MNNRFSFRRFWLLARKHYTENRQNYLVIAGIYALMLAYGIWACLRGNYPSLDAFEVMVIFAFIVTPIWSAKMNFTPYVYTGKQLGGFTLPATQGEKFLFAVLNTILLTALAVALIEIPASILHSHIDFVPDWSNGSTLVGVWFSGLAPLVEVSLIFFSTAILACTMAHRGNVGKPMFLIWGVLILIHALPILLLPQGDGTSIAELNVPSFTALFEGELWSGKTLLAFESERLITPALWHTFVLPAILLVSAWFKFKEYQVK